MTLLLRWLLESFSNLDVEGTYTLVICVPIFRCTLAQWTLHPKAKVMSSGCDAVELCAPEEDAEIVRGPPRSLGCTSSTIDASCVLMSQLTLAVRTNIYLGVEYLQ